MCDPQNETGLTDEQIARLHEASEKAFRDIKNWPKAYEEIKINPKIFPNNAKFRREWEEMVFRTKEFTARVDAKNKSDRINKMAVDILSQPKLMTRDEFIDKFNSNNIAQIADKLVDAGLIKFKEAKLEPTYDEKVIEKARDYTNSGYYYEYDHAQPLNSINDLLKLIKELVNIIDALAKAPYLNLIGKPVRVVLKRFNVINEIEIEANLIEIKEIKF